jgi:hypothetical protein
MKHLDRRLFRYLPSWERAPVFAPAALPTIPRASWLSGAMADAEFGEEPFFAMAEPFRFEGEP